MNVPLRAAEDLAAFFVYDIKPVAAWIALVPRKLTRVALFLGRSSGDLKDAIVWVAVRLDFNFDHGFEFFVGGDMTELQRHDQTAVGCEKER